MLTKIFVSMLSRFFKDLCAMIELTPFIPLSFEKRGGKPPKAERVS